MSSAKKPAHGSRPVVGMIVPPAAHEVPPEATAMYGEAVQFLAVGLGLGQLTPEGYDSVLPKIETAAQQLRDRGAQGIALMGTSLSFYRGAAFNRTLTVTMHEATGLPCTTMSTAVVEALACLGARRVAVATAYGDVVNQRLSSFLAEHGIEVGGLDALHIEDVRKVFEVVDEDLMRVTASAIARCELPPEAILISCGGLRTLGVAERLEDRFGLPVVTSSTAGPWAAVRLVGHDGRALGCGRLFRQESVAA